MQTDPKLFHLKCLLEGAVYKELGEEDMAVQVSGRFLHSFNLSWAVQSGLLTPLTFTQHRLSPSAAFTSGVSFLHNGKRWQWICKVYTANLEGIFEGLESECVCQQAVTCRSCSRVPQTAFFVVVMNSQFSGQPKSDVKTLFSTLHHISPVIFATATVWHLYCLAILG